MSARIAIELLRGLAWLGENFPDNPRLGRKLLFGGGILLCAFFCTRKTGGVGRRDSHREKSLRYFRRCLHHLGQFCFFPALGLEAAG